MKIFETYTDLPHEAQGAVIAIGNFDGVHRGHMVVLNEARKKAESLGVPLGLMTFEPHPQRLFRPGDPPFRITSFPVKIRRLEQSCVDLLFSVTFDWDFASMSAEQFIETIIKNGLKPAHIVIGDDFHFGQLRKGNIDMLREAGFDVTVVKEQATDSGARFSSSLVRNALQAGDIGAANFLLGWKWEVQEKVVHGEKIGRTIGYPTANLPLADTIHPAYGVYAAYIKIIEDGKDANWLPSVINIGIRPMFKISTGQLEAHIFDFDRDIYGKHLRVRPVKRLRGEAKFATLERLAEQIARDCEEAKKILSLF